MAVRSFALVFGIIFLVLGIAGFIPALTTPITGIGTGLTIDAGTGLLFGLFPVNVVHNIVHLIFGVLGVLAFRSFPAALVYARSVAVIFIVLTILGFIPVLRTIFGIVPLYGHDIWLHAIIAVVAGYMGFIAHSGPPRTT